MIFPVYSEGNGLERVNDLPNVPGLVSDGLGLYKKVKLYGLIHLMSSLR